MDSEVAIVGLGVHAMKVVLIEQLGNERGKCLGCESGALTVGCKRDADLGGSGLPRYDAYAAVATQGAGESLDRGQLHPHTRRAT